MKVRRIQRFIRGVSAATLIGFSGFLSTPVNAAHEHIYALQYGGLYLFDFYSDAPQSIQTAYQITGLQFGESIHGIDFWDGTIYGLGSSSRLYTIDPNTGAATQVGSGQFSTILNGFTFGVDNDASGFRAVSGNGQNLLISRTTGTVMSSGPNIVSPARVDALAHDDASGIWYGGDTLANTFGTLNPATGLYSTIGLAGIDVARYNGLDVSPYTGIMYLDTPAASSDPQANFYTVDKLTGFALLMGQIGNPGDNILVQGLTVVPEPSSIALLTLGALGLLFVRRQG
jgi:hypothetical protein